MKSILYFDLPEEQEEFDRTIKATDMALFIWELVFNGKKNMYRQLETDLKDIEDKFEVVDKVWEYIHEQLNNRNIDIDSMIS